MLCAGSLASKSGSEMEYKAAGVRTRKSHYNDQEAIERSKTASTQLLITTLHQPRRTKRRGRSTPWRTDDIPRGPSNHVLTSWPMFLPPFWNSHSRSIVRLCFKTTTIVPVPNKCPSHLPAWLQARSTHSIHHKIFWERGVGEHAE